MELRSSVFEDSREIDADGDNSDLAITTSFFDCSYSSFETIKFGLLISEIFIAEFKFFGI